MCHGVMVSRNPGEGHADLNGLPPAKQTNEKCYILEAARGKCHGRKLGKRNKQGTNMIASENSERLLVQDFQSTFARGIPPEPPPMITRS